MEAGFDLFFGKLRIIVLDDLVGVQACLQEFQNQMDQYTGPLNARLTMADMGIDGNKF
jgi:hypothetical protein